RERRAHQRVVHVLGDGEEPVAEDLHGDGIEAPFWPPSGSALASTGVGLHQAPSRTSTRMLPHESTLARDPGASATVELSSSITAGPVSSICAGMRPRA